LLADDPETVQYIRDHPGTSSFIETSPEEPLHQKIKTMWVSVEETVWNIETTAGVALYRQDAPSFYAYLLWLLFPIAGFLIPWGCVHAIRWVVSGFIERAPKAKTAERRSSTSPVSS
jgi:hypothetical protein